MEIVANGEIVNCLGPTPPGSDHTTMFRALTVRRTSPRFLSTAAPTTSGGIKFWHVALAVSAPVAYYIVRDRRKTAALHDASTYLISPLHTEVDDLATRANLTCEQVEKLQNDLRRQPNWSSEQLSYLLGLECKSAHPWEILCLFRNSPTDRHRLDFEEVAVGLSSLVKGSELRLAWRAVDPDLRPLSFESFALLLDRMVRTGHFTGHSLLRQTLLLPPEWSVLSGQGVAERFYSALAKKHDEPISLEEFQAKANGLSADGDLVLWYLRKKSAKSQT